MSATKFRLRFAKQGDLRLVSHHDLLRCFERLIRRAAVPVAHSQGFNPRPRLVFPLALALGIEGLREVVEVELTESMTADELRERLTSAAPPGLSFQEIEAVGPGRSPQVTHAIYSLPVPASRVASATASVHDFLDRDRVPYARQRPDRGSVRELDLRRFVETAAIGDDQRLRFRLAMASDGSARPEEVVEAFGLRDLTAQGAVLVREDVELAPPRTTVGDAPQSAAGSQTTAYPNLKPDPDPDPGSTPNPSSHSNPTDRLSPTAIPT